MDADDASFAEMRRRFTDADPLALDEETVERLLVGDLPPSQVPPGYARVAALLAATTAPPTPEELAGQAEVLAELRAVTRPRRAGAHTRRAGAHTRRAARPPRRRWAGLAAAALVGALVTGGAAAAATGNLPGPVRDVARNILDTAGGAGPGTATMPAPASHASTPGSIQAGQSTRPTGATGSGSATTGAAAAPNPNLEGLCQAYLSSKGAEQGKKLDSAAFEALVRAAGGKEKVPDYCQTLPPEGKRDKEKQPAPPDNPGQGQGQSQGGPPPSSGGGDNGQGGRADERS
jgi:hypothetical protein